MTPVRQINFWGSFSIEKQSSCGKPCLGKVGGGGGWEEGVDGRR